jgi:UDP-2,4-diacetamido-2,4,6-trideoxy-beta-L-altropyranose hydrolase
MKQKLFIRADGSMQIGLGHLIRCLSLANMLENYFQICFVCKEIPESTIRDINESHFLVSKIETEEFFLEMLAPGDFVVLDGYGFGFEYQIEIKKRKCKIISIDDQYQGKFISDLIINHAPGVTINNYHAESYTDFALGHEYALLRPKFLKQARNYRKIYQKDKIFICFGGADKNDYTKKIISILTNIPEFIEIIVVTGPEYTNLNSLLKCIRNDFRIIHWHDINENKMIELMLNVDIAIVPASGILFEVMAAGCIPISGYYVENQLDNYNGFLNLGGFIDAKSFLNNDIENALLKINQFPQVRLIDGNSNERILQKIKKLEYVNSDIDR